MEPSQRLVWSCDRHFLRFLTAPFYPNTTERRFLPPPPVSRSPSTPTSTTGKTLISATMAALLDPLPLPPPSSHPLLSLPRCPCLISEGRRCGEIRRRRRRAPGGLWLSRSTPVRTAIRRWSGLLIISLPRVGSYTFCTSAGSPPPFPLQVRQFLLLPFLLEIQAIVVVWCGVRCIFVAVFHVFIWLLQIYFILFFVFCLCIFARS